MLAGARRIDDVEAAAAVVARVLVLMLRRIPRGGVCHPSVVWAKIFETQASESAHLWENHEMKALCLSSCARALVQEQQRHPACHECVGTRGGTRVLLG